MNSKKDIKQTPVLERTQGYFGTYNNDARNDGRPFFKVFRGPSGFVKSGLITMLSGSALKLVLVLLDYSNSEWESFPSRATITKLTGLSRSLQRSAESQLIKLGLLRVAHQGNNQILYTLLPELVGPPYDRNGDLVVNEEDSFNSSTGEGGTKIVLPYSNLGRTKIVQGGTKIVLSRTKIVQGGTKIVPEEEYIEEEQIGEEGFSLTARPREAAPPVGGGTRATKAAIAQIRNRVVAESKREIDGSEWRKLAFSPGISDSMYLKNMGLFGSADNRSLITDEDINLRKVCYLISMMDDYADFCESNNKNLVHITPKVMQQVVDVIQNLFDVLELTRTGRSYRTFTEVSRDFFTWLSDYKSNKTLNWGLMVNLSQEWKDLVEQDVS